MPWPTDCKPRRSVRPPEGLPILLENEIEAETRRRLAGRHVELAAVKARLVAEQATARAEAECAKLEAGVSTATP